MNVVDVAAANVFETDSRSVFFDEVSATKLFSCSSLITCGAVSVDADDNNCKTSKSGMEGNANVSVGSSTVSCPILEKNTGVEALEALETDMGKIISSDEIED